MIFSDFINNFNLVPVLLVFTCSVSWLLCTWYWHFFPLDFPKGLVFHSLSLKAVKTQQAPLEPKQGDGKHLEFPGSEDHPWRGVSVASGLRLCGVFLDQWFGRIFHDCRVLGWVAEAQRGSLVKCRRDQEFAGWSRFSPLRRRAVLDAPQPPVMLWCLLSYILWTVWSTRSMENSEEPRKHGLCLFLHLMFYLL